MAESLNHLASETLWEAGALAHSERALHVPLAEPQTTGAGTSLLEPLAGELAGASQPDGSHLPLVARLCAALRSQNVTYCHWKSNWKLARWMKGEGDLDLLVDRADAQTFAGVVHRLGFKQAEPSTDRQMPGILNYYGFDCEANRFVHLHVHYQLVLGHDLTKNYRLPIEKLYLESVGRDSLMPVPAPELELIVFTLRMVLKYSASETLMRRMFRRAAGSTNAVVRELEYLERQTDIFKARAILEQHIPFLDPAFFDRCVKSLRAGTPAWTRTLIRRELKSRLRAHARRPQTLEALTKAGRRVTRLFRERLLRRSSRKQLVNSGALIAVIGGDGAGKTTSVNQLQSWLSKKFVVRRFHLGKPRRSSLTLLIIIALRARRLLRARFGSKSNDYSTKADGAQTFPGYLQLLRWVCAARDRRRVYMKARRFATNGGLALCDRYVIPQIRLMDGPNIARSVAPARTNALIKILRDAEERYYRHILPPDLLIVLRVDPEIAVRRKTDEHESHVRTRSRELWEVDWRGTRAHVVDAGRAIEEVTAQLRSLIWANI